MHVVKWIDLMGFKPDGLDDSLYSSLLHLIFFNRPCNCEEIKESDIVIEISETLSCNLSFTWKLKQGLGIIVQILHIHTHTYIPFNYCEKNNL